MKTFSAFIVLLFFLSNCKHDNVKHDNVKHDNVKHDNVKHDNVKHDNVKHDNVKHDNVKHDNVVVSNYIEIRHAGLQEKSIRPLIISTEKVYFEVNRSDVTFFDSKKDLTPEIKEAYLNIKYNLLITDTITYQSIIDFIDKNQDLIINNINKNRGDYAVYSITINSRERKMYYNCQHSFFLELRLYLKMTNGDKSLIRELEYY